MKKLSFRLWVLMWGYRLSHPVETYRLWRKVERMKKQLRNALFNSPTTMYPPPTHEEAVELYNWVTNMPSGCMKETAPSCLGFGDKE